MLALQSPIEYQKEQSQSQGAAVTLRKTNSQPASMMQSTLSQPSAHSQYSRMVSLPQPRTTVAMVKSNAAAKGQKTMDKVRGSQEVKGRSSAGSPQQGRRTIFAGLRSSLIRLSKSPSHEDLRRETSNTATAAVADAIDHEDNDDDVDEDDDDSKVKGNSERGSGENVVMDSLDTSESDCRHQQPAAVHHDAIPAQSSNSATL